MKAVVNGACGKMGRLVVDLLKENCRGFSLAAAVEKSIPDNPPFDCFSSLGEFKGNADVIIDFSNHAAAKELCDYAVKHKMPAVIATTGFSDDELNIIESAAEKIPVFLCANTSVGIALLAELAKRTAAVMQGADIEIVEKHHNMKLDAPSGTALMLAKEIDSVLPQESDFVYGRHGHHKREKKEIGIHSLRLGNVVGVHEIIITTGDETITLTHEAHNRSLLAQGALAAAEFIVARTQPGLYSMKELIAGK